MADVDTSIHPTTTGRAATLASLHSSPAISHPSAGPPQYLTLYGGWFCPFVQRIWIVLHEKNIPHQYVEINPYKKEKHFLQLNPRGLVPTLAISDTNPSEIVNDTQNGINGTTTTPSPPKEKVLYESSVVADYLDQIYSPPPPPSSPSSPPSTLYPSDPYSRARSRLWIDHISTRIIPSFYRFLQHTPSSSYTLPSARAEFITHLRTFIAEFSDTLPFFNGADLTMPDIMLIPWASRIFLLDHYKGGSGIPKAGEAENEAEEKIWERWRTWFDAVQERESVRDTLSERERYIEVYQRYAEDKTGSQVGQATRGGRGLP